MAGELSDMDQVSAEVMDRLVAWHYLRHPDQARDWVIAELRDKYNIPPDRGMPMTDAAIIRSQGWTREQAEALSDALEGWPDLPVPLTAVPVLPAFPAGVYPPCIEAEISALAESTQTPRDLAAMVILGVLATACARRAVVEVTSDWSEPTNLYIVPAMASGTRKSPVYGPLVSPLLNAEKMLADKAKEEIAQKRTDRAIADKAAAKAERAAADAVAEATRIAADPASTEEARQQAEQDKQKAAADAVAKAQLADAVEVPVMPRLIANDVTPEKMAQLLSEQGGRLAVISDEGGPLISLAGRYSTSKEPDAEVWLTAHNGLHAEIRVDRIGRPSDWVQNPALTVCLAIQPVVLRRLYRILQLRDRGLMGRFLYAMPPDNVGYRKVRTTPVPQQVAADYWLRMTEVVTTLASWADPMVLQLDPGALEIHTLFRETSEPRLRPDADLVHLREWAGKLAGAVARIAGLLHVAWNAGEAYKYRIAQNTMAAAIAIGEYLIDHALAAFDYMSDDLASGDAREVLAWIRRKGLTQFTQRDMHRAMPSRFRRADDAEAVLELLSRYGWVREEKQPREGRGRPPSPLFKVHPCLLRQKNTLGGALTDLTEMVILHSWARSCDSWARFRHFCQICQHTPTGYEELARSSQDGISVKCVSRPL